MLEKRLNVGTFNVRGLSSFSKRKSLSRDLSAYGVDICCLQETKLANGIDERHGDFRILCLETSCRHYGLGFAISRSLKFQTDKFWKLSDRVAAITFSDNRNNNNNTTSNNNNGNGTNNRPVLAVINVYAPTSTKCAENADELDLFYSALEKAYDEVKGATVVLISGDFNAKVGTRQSDNELCIGSHGRGRRNISGQSLIDFCELRNLFLANTTFQHSARHKTTWTGWRKDHATNTSVPIYNQIDYVLCRQRQKRLLTDARSYGGCETPSDHRLVVARLDLNRIYGIFFNGRARTVQRNQHKLNLTNMPTDRELRMKYNDELTSRLLNVDRTVESPAELWNQSVDAINSAAREVADVQVRGQATSHSKIEDLSRQQKELRLQIENTTNPSKKAELKHKRNVILHEIRREALREAEAKLDARAKEVERLQHGAQMFKAVQLMKRKKSQKVKIQDDAGKMIGNDQDAALAIASHFADQFNDHPTATKLDPFIGPPRPLNSPVTVTEVQRSLDKLNNGRAAGYDNIPAELLKYGATQLSPIITTVFNNMFNRNEQVDIGNGVLIPLPKPGKPPGLPTSLRPIILLSTLRKSLSLITLRRIMPKVDIYLADTHSGFRPGRSTADAVWAHRWFAAKCQRYKWELNVYGIDMSRAFDTIRRDLLMDVLAGIVEEDELRMIRLLLSGTHLSVRIGGATSQPFDTTVGTPQGDSLSPVLFIVYLEAALRDVRRTAPPRVASDAGIPFEIVYADDTDFLSTSQQWLNSLEDDVVAVLGNWFLNVNPSKTEKTRIFRSKDRIGEEWRSTKKLGSLLGDEEDVMRRKQLATIMFQSMWSMWKRRDLIHERLRLRLYNAFVLPVLTYNCGTWGLTAAVLERLDSFHRKQLRSLLGVHYLDRMKNATLYERCQAEPISKIVQRSRWRLFGQNYFTSSSDDGVLKWKGRPRTTLPVVIAQDLKRVDAGDLANCHDLHTMKALASNRQAWRNFCKRICC